MSCRAIVIAALMCGSVANLGCEVPQTSSAAALPPGIIDKRLFESDRGWYYQKTYLELPGNADVAVEATVPVSPMRKIRWELQENWLIAHRYERPFTAETDSAQLAVSSQPELAFPVQHYDVFLNQAAAVPSRPWYQRSHVYVDWSNPTLEGSGYIDLQPSDFDAERFWVTDPADRDAPVFTEGYLDVVVRGSLRFDVLAPFGADSAAYCFDRDSPDCTGGRVSYRLSFMRASESDYQPMPVPDVLSENTFPVFKTAQRHFSDQYGFTDGAKTALAMRFDVWERTQNADGSTIPLVDRVPSQRAVYLSPSWPAELVPEVEASLAVWNAALREALEARRSIDCQARGCTPTPLTGWSWFVLCANNPVRDGDPSPCGAPGTTARLGDVRRVLLNWSQHAGRKVPIATAYWAADPETGELLGGLVNVSGAFLDRQAQTVVDAVRLINNGGSFLGDYGAGRSTFAWVKGQASHQVGEPFSKGQGLTRAPDSQTAATAPPAVPIDWSWLSDATAPKGVPDARTMNGLWGGRSRRALERLVAEGNLGALRRQALQNTAFEDGLLDFDTLAYFEEDPFAKVAEASKPALSPLRRGAWWERQPKATDTFAVDASFQDLDVAELAPAYQGVSDAEIFSSLRKQQAQLVLTHEIGHLLALRHNFGGSYDAFNYPNQYWALRTAGGAGPRWNDPLTAAERSGGIRRVSSASVMDYAPGPQVWNRELGRWDKAAVKWLYGGLVEVMDGPKNRANAATLNQLGYWYRFYSPTPVVGAPDRSKGSLHYTDLPRFFDLDTRTDFPVEQLVNFFNNPEVIPGSGANATPDGRVMAPWHVCSDNAPRVTGCGQQDTGADPYEVATDMLERERGYYLYTHFRRGFLGFPSYRRANLNALARDMESALLFSATIAGLIVNDPTLFAPGEGLETYSRALQAGLDGIGERVTMPEVGHYASSPNADGLVSFQNDGVGPLNLELDRARYYSGAVLNSNDNAHDYLQELQRKGFAGDKNAAIDMLTYGADIAGVAGITDVGNVRKSVAGYYRFFPRQVNDFLGALLTDDWTRAAPAWSGTQLERPRISDPTWTVGANTPVDPMVTLAVKLRAVTVGYPSLFAASADRSFADLVRIWVVGTGSTVTGGPTVSWVDTLTGKTYQAHSLMSSGRESGIGARLLLRATRLEVRAMSAPTASERALAQQTLEEVRYLVETTRLVVERVERGGAP